MTSPKFSKNSNATDPDSDLLRITPLGAGQEVGRSCIILEFKTKKIMLDCGIHPGYSGILSLPFFDEIDPLDIDAIFITHFHLDHCGALPWFLSKTHFKGRVFMTHATKAIYKWLLSDFIKISSGQAEPLFGERDLAATLDRIEAVHFHQQVETCGIRFTCYHAGHVLGAAMFLIEIAGVKVLYTGDFSRQEDRHLMSAELPSVRPDVLIMESTYGIYIHEKREIREQRFTGAVRDVVLRGGRCLIPAFALGRAQEQLLILDEFWEQHKAELGHIPVYYASALARKCMAVYQTYSGAMNQSMREKMAIDNPFKFKNISFLKGMSEFNDDGPCVIIASPGMLQNGFSRDLFELWCSDPKNGVIIAGYSVEGTLAKELMSEPEQVTSLAGRPLARRCSIDYISFSAHADYYQFKELVEGLLPPNIVLVHGEANEMNRLKNSLLRDLAQQQIDHIKIHTPKNTCSLDLYFKGEMLAKVFGKLIPSDSSDIKSKSGIIVKNGFSYKIFDLNEIEQYSELKVTQIHQKLNIPFPDDDRLYECLVKNLSLLIGSQIEETIHLDTTLVFSDDIELSRKPGKLILNWVSDVGSDFTVDAIIAVALETARNTECRSPPNIEMLNEDKKYVGFIEVLKKNYGSENVLHLEDGTLHLILDESEKAIISPLDGIVTCHMQKIKERLERMLFHYNNSIQPFCNCKCSK